MKSFAIIMGTAALGIHGIAGAALPVDFLKRQLINGSKSHCGPGADLCGWRESGPLCCSPPPDDPGNGSFPPGNIIGTRDEKDSNVRRGKTSDSFPVCKDGTFTITRAMAEEVRPFYASTDKTKCNECRVFQDPFDMCEELRENFSWALFFECYKDLPCPTKRDAMPQSIPGTDSKDKLHAPELNPGEKGQKLSQESEIETSTGAGGGAELIPDPVPGTSELRPRQISFPAYAHQNPNKAVQEAAKAGQEIIEDKDFHGDGRCWVLHGNTHDCRKKLQDPNAEFKVAPFYDCYDAKKCPKKRSRIPDAPELNPGAKGQKLSHRSEIDARAALADAVPDPSSKDANVLAAAMYNGRLQERTDTEIAERDAIPDLPTHLDEEYYRYTERQIANPDPTASHPYPAPKPEIRRAWGGAGMLNHFKPKPKSKPPHPAQSRSRRAWGGAGMVKHSKPKPPHPAQSRS